MSELWYRPAEATPARDLAQLPDSPRQSDQRGAPDTRHDADAQFKHPVAKPDGYLPGDTAPTAPTRREGGDWITRRDELDLTWQRTPAEAPALKEVAATDHPHALRAVVERPDCHNPDGTRAPDRYGDPLTRPDGSRIPCLDGPPRREQTSQGWAGDCGIIAALGAVAAHRPEDITRRIRPRDDGSHQVTFSEAHWVGAVSQPTGRDIELTITPEVPIFEEEPSVPACALTEEDTLGALSWKRRSPG